MNGWGYFILYSIPSKTTKIPSSKCPLFLTPCYVKLAPHNSLFLLTSDIQSKEPEKTKILPEDNFRLPLFIRLLNLSPLLATKGQRIVLITERNSRKYMRKVMVRFFCAISSMLNFNIGQFVNLMPRVQLQHILQQSFQIKLCTKIYYTLFWRISINYTYQQEWVLFKVSQAFQCNQKLSRTALINCKFKNLFGEWTSLIFNQLCILQNACLKLCPCLSATKHNFQQHVLDLEMIYKQQIMIFAGQ